MFSTRARTGTGKSNLPGSRRERQLLRSFARMAPELLRHSANPALADRFAEHLRLAHRPSAHTQAAPRVQERAAAAAAAAAAMLPEGIDSLWDADLNEDVADEPTNLRGAGGKRKRGKSVGDETYELDADEEEAFGTLFDAF